MYADVWRIKNGWPGFLRGDCIKEFYETWEEASLACRKLNIQTSKNYKHLYKNDPKLPANPTLIYKSVWRQMGGWPGYLGKTVYYANYEEASSAARRLNVGSKRHYAKIRLKDPRLPSNPEKKYCKEWENGDGWYGFLGIERLYQYWDEASIAATKLECTSRIDYKAKHKLNPKLPSRPDIVFSSVWEKNGGWRSFLGLPPWYDTVKSASEAAKKLEISNRTSYKKLHTQDQKLHPNPDLFYAQDWAVFGGWENFLGLIPTYKNWQEAHNSALNLKFKNASDYSRRRYLDPRLPVNPKYKFRAYWASLGGWEGFLGLPQKVDFFPTWQEASEFSISNNIQNKNQYLELADRDKRLPRSPETVYKNVWIKNGGWPAFLGSASCYCDWDTVNQIALHLKIKTPKEYKAARNVDPQLPSTPHLYFASEWDQRGGWNGLLLPRVCETLDDVRHAARVLGIKDSSEYKKISPLYTQLPSHPERKFKNEWISWYDLCDIPIPYDYEEAMLIARKNGVRTIAEYKQLVITNSDPRLPKCPDQVYKSNWLNWHVFLGNKEPYSPVSIRSPYEEWKKSIEKFMFSARGGKDKSHTLCMFVREYIIKNNLGKTPFEFLTSKNANIAAYRDLIEQTKDTRKRKVINYVNEFLDHFVESELTIEDESSGVLVTIDEARNPLKNIVWNISPSYSRQYESNKPTLAYQYVKDLKEWIFPIGAKTYSDLRHLHQFTADWVDIDESMIDKDDPDCVFKIENGKHKIWFPAYWTHLYTLANTAARGRQVAYNDSGEADNEMPTMHGEEIVWVENPSKLKGLTSNQGFIKKLDDGRIGMRFTTNKSLSNEGYHVPWMPIDLAFWIIKLRDWQTKYNPIKKPEPWLKLKDTNINKINRAKKGANCFLFRDFNSGAPGNFTGRLAGRLAAALYFTQPKDMPHATLSGPTSSLASYSSKFSPHSLRTSLITSFIFEFGLPPEWVMKIVGHKTLVMTMRYAKPTNSDFVKVFDKAEKKALKDSAYAKQRMIEQNRIEEIKSELICSSKDGVAALSNHIPSGNYLFRDYGFCPNAGTRCDDGGEYNEGGRTWKPVQPGYLGMQNCIRCRHFITGPAFSGGLLSLCNQLFYASREQAMKHSSIDKSIQEITSLINLEEDLLYDRTKDGFEYDESTRNELSLKKRRLCSEQERCAKKLDLFLCDLNSIYLLIKMCEKLTDEKIDSATALKLIASPRRELEFIIEEMSNFRQLSELCEDAEIYEMADCDAAIYSRSQILDQLARNNNLEPRLFTLSKEQQLAVGNQMTNLLLKRLKCWDSVDELISGRKSLEGLDLFKDISISELSGAHPIRLKSGAN